MNTFVLEVWDDESARCTFYSVRYEDATENETDRFFFKYNAIDEFKRPVQELLSFILDSVGNDYGAIDALFNRFENEVIGLPTKGKVTLGELTFLYPSFPLRLYALRVNNRPDLVILFGGGVKTAQTNQLSKELHLKWIEACLFAKRIDAAFRNGELLVDEHKRKIFDINGDDIIYL